MIAPAPTRSRQQHLHSAHEKRTTRQRALTHHSRPTARLRRARASTCTPPGVHDEHHHSPSSRKLNTKFYPQKRL
ncbi:hypothetical protein BD410DRAFT_847258 [Rickenella mellea]|uniref:Uncharacterized protein n=1 Tax=Rickenella mellea TaxID=50990 RepID=A0A4Y7PDU8_9AGAM|nr:hypothetical protein BD410DRAFT_847258 [Rickenella mellea]